MIDDTVREVTNRVTRRIDQPISVDQDGDLITVQIGEAAYLISPAEAFQMMKDLRRAIIKVDRKVLRT